MENLILNAEKRTKEETAKSLRNSKKLVGVVYGKHKEPISIKTEYSDFLKLFRKAGVSNIINLKIGKDNIEVLVHDYQRHPITGDYINVDFYALTRGEVLTTNIQLNFIGSSEAIKEGAILEELLKEIEVKCLPKNLVNSFEVDLSLLKTFGDSIRVGDLNIDEKIFELITNINDVIVTASKPRKVSEEVENTQIEEVIEEEEK